MFTDQAYTYIFLAEDEARMLNRATVQPEHLLLALARGGNVGELLATRGVTASQICSALIALQGMGDDLVLGSVPRSDATEESLNRAVIEAAKRGAFGASGEHVLLGVRDEPQVAALLRGVGICDVEALVTNTYPSHTPPVPLAQITRLALRAARTREPSRPMLIPPVFERYTARARASVSAATAAAASLQNRVVSPFHFIIGMLTVGDNLASAVLSSHGITAERVIRAAKAFGPGPACQVTGLFDQQAHDAVSQMALRYAYRRRDPHITTGHLLLATLDCANSTTTRILGSKVVAEHVARECLMQLPGRERP